MITLATIKSIQDTMRKDVGIDGDAQRLGQMVWMFFLKVLDDREVEWELLDESYRSPLPEALRWRSWAAQDEGLTGDDLLDFINRELFPGLKALRPRAGSSAEMAMVIRSVFVDAFNFMKSGTLLRQVANIIERDLDYNTNEARHAFGDIYEGLLKGLQSAGDAGEYYTPRPVTQFMVDMVDPTLGEVVLDPAAGTGGFLLCTLNHLRDRYVDSVEDDNIVQASIRGVEKKPLPHLLCVTNMLLHGIDVPTNIRHDNTLARPLRDYTGADKVDIILTNPPFQGVEEDGIEQNFPPNLRTRETADLFLALTLHILKKTGRAAIVLPDSSLFGEGVKQVLRGRILQEANFHTIVRLPHGVFSPYTDICTNLLFFDRGSATETIWFYELKPSAGEKYTKTKPIQAADFADVRKWWNDRSETESAWAVSASDIASPHFNLNIPNPSTADANAAYQRSVAERTNADARLADFRRQLDGLIGKAPGPVSEQVYEFLAGLGELGGQVPLTTGVLEDLRLALTQFALQGEISARCHADETVAQTLDRLTPSSRRLIRPQSEPPFAIPDHWRWVALADVADFYVGRTPSTSNPRYWADASSAGVPWITISDLSRRGEVTQTGRAITTKAANEVYGRPPISRDTLLMGFKLSLGKTSLTRIEGYHNEAIASFTISDEAFKMYLLWVLPQLVSYAGSNPAVRGSTLNSKSINAMWLAVPPRPEQTRIVENLRWLVGLLEELAYTAEDSRNAAGQVVRSLIARATKPLAVVGAGMYAQ